MRTCSARWPARIAAAVTVHGRATTVACRAIGGSGNVALPTSDVAGDVVHYAALVEIGASIRRLTFTDADVVAASPVIAWIPSDFWRLDARYTYSRSAFDATGCTN